MLKNAPRWMLSTCKWREIIERYSTTCTVVATV
jgi:hypothetical protein